MTALFPDTSPEVERIHIELLRQASAWRKIELLGQLNAMARTLAMSGLGQRYPNAAPAELQRRLADLLLSPDLAARAYGPQPERGGDAMAHPEDARASDAV